MQTSKYQLPFLDVMVIKSNTSISTDIYFKSTDSKQYLNFKSRHPKHTKVNIPFSLAREIKQSNEHCLAQVMFFED